MKAADLNRRVTIKQRVRASDEAGQPLEAWEVFLELWASIRTPTGMGSITQMQDNVPASVNLYSVRVRFREDITPGMRVEYSGQVFDIRQVKLDYGSKDFTDLVCEVGSRTP